MKLIHQYVFKQIFIYSLLAVGIFIFVLVTGNAIRDVVDLLVGGKLSLSAFSYVIGMLVLYVISYALPLGFLAGILLVLGRLSAQKEITAMKASGVSVYHISAPIFFMAILGTLLSLTINFYFAPKAKSKYREFLANALKDNPLEYIRERTFIDDFPGFVIYAGGRDHDSLKDFWIWEMDGNERVIVFLKARRGNFSYDDESDSIILTLVDGSGEKRRESDPENLQDNSLPTGYFKEWSIRLPLNEILGAKEFTKKLSMLTYRELLDRRYEVIASDLPPQNKRKEQIKVQTQIQKNFALAFSVLSLVVIAVPLGIKISRKESYANLAIAVTLALIYYSMMVMATWLESTPKFRPDILVWIPNVFFQSFGLMWLVKVNNV